MKTMTLGRTPLQVSRIALGCMRMRGTASEAVATIQAALEQGINMFDHADIYNRGRSEELFSAIWKEMPGLRSQIVLQSKCGIRFGGDPDPGSPQRYDFSYEHIVRSVEGSLKRLQTDYLDVLLLHRPDALVEPEEVARAFDELQRAGKVRYFGVSNHTAAQIQLLASCVQQPLVVNQLLLNPLDSELLEVGVSLTRRPLPHRVRGDGTLEYCWMNGITIQAWGPLVGGALSGNLPADAESRIVEAAQVVAELAAARGVSREAIVIGWLLRHPAGIQPVIGTTNPARIRAACQAVDITLSHEEWYRIFVAGRGSELP